MTTALMTAFSPGQSPPPVSTPMRIGPISHMRQRATRTWLGTPAISSVRCPRPRRSPEGPCRLEGACELPNDLTVRGDQPVDAGRREVRGQKGATVPRRPGFGELADPRRLGGGAALGGGDRGGVAQRPEEVGNVGERRAEDRVVGAGLAAAGHRV